MLHAVELQAILAPFFCAVQLSFERSGVFAGGVRLLFASHSGTVSGILRGPANAGGMNNFVMRGNVGGATLEAFPHLDWNISVVSQFEISSTFFL
jgi:hypothetical protein